MRKIQDITNQRFGRLTAKEYAFTDKGKSSTWRCLCDCGKETLVVLTSLKNGNTQSCGCLRIERTKAKVAKHKKSHSPEYHAWGNMIQRCENKNHPEYKNYGGRGIVVCKEWRSSFERFFEDMGEKPSPKFSLDRINNEKGYFKENCRWTDASTQATNQREKENKTTGIKNISYSKRDGLYYVAIERKGQRRRKAFKRLDDAVSWKEKVLDELKGID